MFGYPYSKNNVVMWVSYPCSPAFYEILTANDLATSNTTIDYTWLVWLYPHAENRGGAAKFEEPGPRALMFFPKWLEWIRMDLACWWEGKDIGDRIDNIIIIYMQ